MSLEIATLIERFATFVASEGSFPSVYSLVPLQIRSRSGGEVALVTLEWLLSSMCPHVPFHVARGKASIAALVTIVWLFSSMLNPHVMFQVASCDAGKLANCATVKFFSRMGSLV